MFYCNIILYPFKSFHFSFLLCFCITLYLVSIIKSSLICATSLVSPWCPLFWRLLISFAIFLCLLTLAYVSYFGPFVGKATSVSWPYTYGRRLAGNQRRSKIFSPPVTNRIANWVLLPGLWGQPSRILWVSISDKDVLSPSYRRKAVHSRIGAALEGSQGKWDERPSQGCTPSRWCGSIVCAKCIHGSGAWPNSGSPGRGSLCPRALQRQLTPAVPFPTNPLGLKTWLTPLSPSTAPLLKNPSLPNQTLQIPSRLSNRPPLSWRMHPKAESLLLELYLKWTPKTPLVLENPTGKENVFLFSF